MNDFDAFKTPIDAAASGCFRCHKPLQPETLFKTPYAPGRGQYSMECPECGMSTFFDLAKVQS